MGKNCCCCNCFRCCFSWCCCKCCKKEKQKTEKGEIETEEQSRYAPEPTTGSNLNDDEGSFYNGSIYETPITVQPGSSQDSFTQQIYTPGSELDSAYSEGGSDRNAVLKVSGRLDINGTPRDVHGTLIIEDDQGIYNRSFVSSDSGRGGGSGLAGRHIPSSSRSPSTSESVNLKVKGIPSRPISGFDNSSTPSGLSSKPIPSNLSNISFNMSERVERPLPITPENSRSPNGLTSRSSSNITHRSNDSFQGISNRPPMKKPEDLYSNTKKAPMGLRIDQVLQPEDVYPNRVTRSDTMGLRIDKVLPKVYHGETSNYPRSSSSSSEDFAVGHGSATLNLPEKNVAYRAYDYNEPYDHRMQYPTRKPKLEDDQIYGNEPIINPIREQLKNKRAVPPPPIVLRAPVPAPRTIEEEIYCEIEI